LDELLNNLVGRWSLTGKMGESALYQKVEASWILRGLLLQMCFSPLRVGEDGNPDYEALYLIGHDQKTGEYILHLFDTYGVASKHVPGIGQRNDNSIRFKFDYHVGPWFNTFTWDPSRKSWKNVITFTEKDGREPTFAVKELTPIQ
jgi:hypothetical protein